MEIKHEDYFVSYNPKTYVVTCAGTFRLRGSEYESITELLNKVADDNPETITLDVRELQFLNSSGINMLSKFVIRVRKNSSSRMVLRGSQKFPWQRKSLKNLQRLKPDLSLELE
jgi:hypothetical protein